MNQQTTAKNQHRCRAPKYTDSKSAGKFLSISVFTHLGQIYFETKHHCVFPSNQTGMETFRGQ